MQIKADRKDRISMQLKRSTIRWLNAQHALTGKPKQVIVEECIEASMQIEASTALRAGIHVIQ